MTSRVGLAIVGLAIASLVVSSGGVSSVAVERPIEVAVADHVSEQPVVFDETRNGSAIGVTNQVTETVAVEKAIVDESAAGDRASNVTVHPPEATIGSGETGWIDVTAVSCDGEVRVPIEITVATDSMRIETTVHATVPCDG